VQPTVCFSFDSLFHPRNGLSEDSSLGRHIHYRKKPKDANNSVVCLVLRCAFCAARRFEVALSDYAEGFEDLEVGRSLDSR
jgi:hypothetical protein